MSHSKRLCWSEVSLAGSYSLDFLSLVVTPKLKWLKMSHSSYSSAIERWSEVSAGSRSIAALQIQSPDVQPLPSYLIIKGIKPSDKTTRAQKQMWFLPRACTRSALGWAALPGHHLLMCEGLKWLCVSTAALWEGDLLHPALHALPSASVPFQEGR